MARSALAQATSFAHLIGLGRAAPPARAAEDDERKQREDESDEDYKSRMDDLDDQEEKEAKAAAKAAATAARLAAAKPKAQDEDEEMEEIDDERKQRDGESDDDFQERMDKLDAKEKAAATRARRVAESDDDKDEKDEADPKARAARGREKARCAAIFATTAAAKRPDMAASLAFGTNLTRTAAINTLKAVVAGERQIAAAASPNPTPSGASLRTRMAAEPVHDVGTEGERPAANTPQTFAAKVLAADKRRRGI